MPRSHRGNVWKGCFVIHTYCWEEPYNSVLCDTLEVRESCSTQYNTHFDLEQHWIFSRFAINDIGGEWHLTLFSQDHTGTDLAEDNLRSIALLYHAMESLSTLLALCVCDVNPTSTPLQTACKSCDINVTFLMKALDFWLPLDISLRAIVMLIQPLFRQLHGTQQAQNDYQGWSGFRLISDWASMGDLTTWNIIGCI